MERRKILLGSGAALATALAGCSSDETSDEEEPDENEPTADGNGDNGDDHDHDDTEIDDVPGFDGTKLDIDSDAVSVTKIEHKGDKVAVVAETEITDHQELYAELKTLADDVDVAVSDLETFRDEIKTIEWVVDHDDKQVISFTIDVEWVVKYYQKELSRGEFLEKVKQTAE